MINFRNSTELILPEQHQEQEKSEETPATDTLNTVKKYNIKERTNWSYRVLVDLLLDLDHDEVRDDARLVRNMILSMGLNRKLLNL
jgi:hypothetical protein